MLNALKGIFSKKNVEALKTITETVTEGVGGGGSGAILQMKNGVLATDTLAIGAENAAKQTAELLKQYQESLRILREGGASENLVQRFSEARNVTTPIQTGEVALNYNEALKFMDSQIKEYKATVESFQKQLTKANADIKAKDAKIAELQKYAEMANVKSAEELIAVMPEEVIKTMDELVKNRVLFHEKFAEYLFTGKTSEEFKELLNKASIVNKAYMDGILDIPEVAEKFRQLPYDSQGCANPLYLTLLRMLPETLRGAKNGSYILSPSVEKQVMQNATSLIKTLAEKNCKPREFGERLERDIIKNVKDTLEYAKEHHKYFLKGVESAKKAAIDRGYDAKVDLKPFDIKNSRVYWIDKATGEVYHAKELDFAVKWGKEA